MYLASVFYGGKPIEHTSVRLSTKDGQEAETATIPFDGGLNYRFTDLGQTTEVVTYKGEHCESAVKLIYANAKERIKVEYKGGKPYTIYMADADKEAIVKTFDLATVLSDIHAMETLKAKSAKKMDYLNQKLGHAMGEKSNAILPYSQTILHCMSNGCKKDGAAIGMGEKDKCPLCG